MTLCLSTFVLFSFLAAANIAPESSNTASDEEGEHTQALLQMTHTSSKFSTTLGRLSLADRERLHREHQEQVAANGPRQVPKVTLIKTSATRANTRVLRVTVVSGHRLLDTDGWWYGDSDPYVEVSIRDHADIKFVTDTKDEDNSPTWNFVREVGDFQSGDTLTFMIWDADHTKSDFMGDANYAPNCETDSGVVKNLVVSRRGKLRVKVECLEGSEHEYVSMAKVATYVYLWWGPAGPWSYAVQHTLATGTHSYDNMAILTKGDECTLVFAGSDDYGDLWKGTDLRTAQDCGYDFHIGFYNELLQMMRTPEWTQNFVPRLQQCSSVSVTGHSLGGAMASIFAGCANADGGFSGGSTFPVPFHVSKLYTVAAPAVASQQVLNGHTETGCFAGARIFNEDRSSFDPVPYLFPTLVHPRVKALKLGNTKNTEYDCTSDVARDGSEWGNSYSMPSKGDHGTRVYLDRLGRMFPAA